MKKFLTIIASFLLAIGAVYAVTSVTQSTDAIESESLNADVFRPVINKAVSDLANTDVPAILVALNELLAPQSDTNATTTTTLYTPRRVNDLLKGQQGGTNRLWISNGLTTNDWVFKINAL